MWIKVDFVCRFFLAKLNFCRAPPKKLAKKNCVWNLLGVKKKLCQKFCWVKKNCQKLFWVKKILGQNFFWVQKNLGRKLFWVKKKILRKFFRVKKNCVGIFFQVKKILVGNFFGLNKIGSEIFLGKKKLCRKFFWVKKIGSEFFLVGNLFWSYKICLCYTAAPCWLEQQQHRVSRGGGRLGGLHTHYQVKPTSTWLWLSWVLTIFSINLMPKRW